MMNVEHLLENAICDLEKYEVHEAYRQFIESPCNIEMAEGTGIRLDDVWVMAVYCDTTLRQGWKEKWKKEAERRIPVTERLPEEWAEEHNAKENSILYTIPKYQRGEGAVVETVRAECVLFRKGMASKKSRCGLLA